MIFNKIGIYAFLLLLIFSCQTLKKPTTIAISSLETPQQKVEDTIQPRIPILTLGENPVYREELMMYAQSRSMSDSITTDSIFHEFCKTYRYYLEGQNRGFLKDAALKEEIEAYGVYLAESAWNDEKEVEQMAKEAFVRFKDEVQLAHILVQTPILSSVGSEEDIQSKRKAEAIRDRIIKKELTFEEAARLYSDDKKTKFSKGELGWFGPLQLVYSLENEAYRLPVGGLSKPIRTANGYHLLLLQNKRAYSGNVTVRHLLKSISPEADSTSKATVFHFLDSLKNDIQLGKTSFEEAVKIHSDDFKNKQNGGLLPSFGIGSRYEQRFEEAAFQLSQSTEIAGPIATQSGYHLIQLVDKQTLDSTEALQLLIEDKIKTDSRGEHLLVASKQKAKQRIDWQTNEKMLDSLLTYIPTSILQKKWQIDWPSSIQNDNLFVHNYGKITFESFGDYLFERQSIDPVPTGASAPNYARKLATDFETQELKKAYTNYLLKVDTSFATQLSLHQMELVSKIIVNEEVIERAVSDTLGQRQMFEQTKQNYVLANRMEGIVMVSDSVKFLNMASELLGEEKPYPLRRGILPFYFKRDQTEIDEDGQRKLLALVGILINNPSYIVEIGGHSDINETDSVSYQRLRNVVDYLTANGLDITRILEVDYGKTRLVERFDWQKNQRVTFQFFSNSREDIVKIIASKYGDVIAIKEGIFSTSDPFVSKNIPYSLGTYNFSLDGKQFRVVVDKLLPARLKTIREVRGQVINMYRKYLQDEFDRKLAEKYPLKMTGNSIEELFNTIQK